MSLGVLLPWGAFLVATLGGAVAWYKVLFLDRPETHQHLVNATQQQDMEERKQILATAKFFSEQVPALQAENAARRAEAIALREQVMACDARITAVEQAGREQVRALLLRHAEELAELQRVVSEQAVRLAHTTGAIA